MAFVRGAMDTIKGENIFGEKNLNETTATLIKNKLKSEGLLKRSTLEFTLESAGGVLAQIFESLEAEKAAVEANRIYEGAFEWRFEFPEVLDENGNYQGFDVVIGNPPYIRQEELGDFKLYLQKHFQTYAGTADLFVYFIERGIQLLKSNGDFIYIVPNKWMRAGYGKALRSWLKNLQIRQLIDFGDLPVFEEATTYPLILDITKVHLQIPSKAALMTSLKFDNSLEKTISEKAFNINVSELKDEGWSLSKPAKNNLLEKIKSVSVPLDKYVNGRIYRGVLTGLNEAFVIDEATKNRLITQDPKSNNIIKPFLAGRDIKRYQQPKVRNYILFIPWHFPLHEDISIKGASKLAEEEFEKNYPAVFNYLKGYKSLHESRNKTETGIRYEWYALQRCAASYYQEFDCPKIVVPAIVQRASYAYDKEKYYGNDKTTIIPTEDMYLLGILNSKVVDFFFKQIGATKQGGFYEYKPVYLSQLPIAKTSTEVKSLIEGKVILILEAKKANSNADTSVLEKEIDQLVYELYGLTEEEIAIVEGETVKAEA
jgi:hypothetical protein